jgi:D-inositol-3-phosphate glycosyltransferase
MRDRPRVLVVGHAVAPTGYARVLHSIIERLHPQSELDFIHFGINYRGEPRRAPWPIVPNQLVGDQLGMQQLPNLLAELHPDLVFMCHDSWLWDVHAPALRAAPGPPKTVFYCPIEWPFARPQDARGLASIDHLVAYTHFGRRALEAAFAALGKGTQGGLRAIPPITVIPHGVDAVRFHPLGGSSAVGPPWPGRRLARALLFPDRPELHDAFIVLNANRNCQRKRIDLSLRAFARFCRGKPDVWLYLHMGLRDAGVDVLAMARDLGIQDRLLLTTTGADRPDVPDETLNLIYNSCDVGLNTAAAEGWGLVAFEHGATGAAQIVPDTGACAELWEEAGLLIPPCGGRGAHEPEDTEELLCAVTAHLERLYHDRVFLTEKSRQAHAYACSPRFSWSDIAGRWRDVFLETLRT